ncbi:MAG: hypothetical protein PHU81_05230 [Acidobacteriota bacterium]|nr:hypothetical protein [Acidobacteriota bacterium]
MEVGFVNHLEAKLGLPATNTVAFVCSSLMMFNTVVKELKLEGIKKQNIYSILERYMKCGIGKCLHSTIGQTLVCADGPVYTCKQIKTLGEQT